MQTNPSFDAPAPRALTRLEHLSDSELLAGTRRLVARSNQLLAELLVHLGEVEARGIHRTRACSSLYTYCIYELRFSEDEAFRRVSAARLVRRFPALLDALASGELHLTGLLMLGPHLTEANLADVLARAKHRTKRELAKIVRILDPLPAVPARIEPLGPAPARLAPPEPTFTRRPNVTLEELQLRAMRALVMELKKKKYAIEDSSPARARDAESGTDALEQHAQANDALDQDAQQLRGRPELMDAPEHTEQPQTRRRGRYVPATVRRSVFERDGNRCSYFDENGTRCPETHRLEFHHLEPFAKGGDHRASNLTLRCAAHNALAAEEDFGRELIEDRKNSPHHESLRSIADEVSAPYGGGLVRSREPSLAMVDRMSVAAR